MDSNTKRILTIIAAGTVAVVTIIGAIFPEARNYALSVTQALLTGASGLFR